MTTVQLYILITVHSFSCVTYLNECTVIYMYIYIYIHIFYNYCRLHVRCVSHLSKKGGIVTSTGAVVRLLRLLSVRHLLLVFSFPVANRDGLNLWNRKARFI